jgi:GGDEF domain-containing protein
MRHVTIPLRGWFSTLFGAVSEALRGPQLLFFALALVLALVWFGARMLWLTLPFALIATLPRQGGRARAAREAIPGQLAEMALAVERCLARARNDAQAVPCILLGIDDFAGLPARHGPEMQARLVIACLDHLARALRPEDRLFDLGEGRFGALLATDRALTDAAARQVADRLGIAAHSAAAAMLAQDAPGVAATVAMIHPRARSVIAATIKDALATLERPAHVRPPRPTTPATPRLHTRAHPRDGPDA